VTYSCKKVFKEFQGWNQADSLSNICKKKTNKKNFFCLTFSKKVYVFNHQQLINDFFFHLFNILIIRYLSSIRLVCMCNTIHYELLLQIQHDPSKMRTILPLIQTGFLRARLSEFYKNFI